VLRFRHAARERARLAGQRLSSIRHDDVAVVRALPAGGCAPSHRRHGCPLRVLHQAGRGATSEGGARRRRAGCDVPQPTSVTATGETGDGGRPARGEAGRPPDRGAVSERPDPDGPEPEAPASVPLIEHRVHPLAVVLKRPVIAHRLVICAAILRTKVGWPRLHPAGQGPWRRFHVCKSGAEAEGCPSEASGDNGFPRSVA